MNNELLKKKIVFSIYNNEYTMTLLSEMLELVNKNIELEKKEQKKSIKLQKDKYVLDFFSGRRIYNCEVKK